MACRKGCGSSLGNIELIVKDLIRQMIEAGQLQEGLIDCNDNRLWRNGRVVTCDILADAVCQLAEEGTLCFKEAESIAIDGNQICLLFNDGTKKCTTINVKDEKVNGFSAKGTTLTITLSDGGKYTVDLADMLKTIAATAVESDTEYTITGTDKKAVTIPKVTITAGTDGTATLNVGAKSTTVVTTPTTATKQPDGSVKITNADGSEVVTPAPAKTYTAGNGIRVSDDGVISYVAPGCVGLTDLNDIPFTGVGTFCINGDSAALNLPASHTASSAQDRLATAPTEVFDWGGMVVKNPRESAVYITVNGNHWVSVNDAEVADGEKLPTTGWSKWRRVDNVPAPQLDLGQYVDNKTVQFKNGKLSAVQTTYIGAKDDITNLNTMGACSLDNGVYSFDTTRGFPTTVGYPTTGQDYSGLLIKTPAELTMIVSNVNDSGVQDAWIRTAQDAHVCDNPRWSEWTRIDNEQIPAVLRAAAPITIANNVIGLNLNTADFVIEDGKLKLNRGCLTATNVRDLIKHKGVYCVDLRYNTCIGLPTDLNATKSTPANSVVGAGANQFTGTWTGSWDGGTLIISEITASDAEPRNGVVWQLTIEGDNLGEWQRLDNVDAAQTTEVIEVTKLSPSQLFTQTSNDFDFIELHERPAWSTGLTERLVSEVSGYKDVIVTGLGTENAALNWTSMAAIFPFNDVKILSLQSEIYQITDGESAKWDQKVPEMSRELIVKPEANKTTVTINCLTSFVGDKDKQYKFRIYYTIRVAERNN